MTLHKGCQVGIQQRCLCRCQGRGGQTRRNA